MGSKPGGMPSSLLSSSAEKVVVGRVVVYDKNVVKLGVNLCVRVCVNRVRQFKRGKSVRYCCVVVSIGYHLCDPLHSPLVVVV